MSARCQVAQALIEADKRPEQIATGFDLFKAERLDVNEPEARADGLEPAAQGRDTPHFRRLPFSVTIKVVQELRRRLGARRPR